MTEGVIRKVFRLGEAGPTRLPSGGTKWLLARVENLSLYVVDDWPGNKFAVPGHPEEVLVFVLEGQVAYEDGRIVRGGEMAFQLPNTSYKGRYVGPESIRLIEVRCLPKPGSPLPEPGLMKKVIRPQDIQAWRKPESGGLRKTIVVTHNLGVDVAENRPFLETMGLAHPQAEILYVMQGKMEYLDGRVVRAGEAICNLPGEPHPCRFVGVEPLRVMEIKSPPS